MLWDKHSNCTSPDKQIIQEAALSVMASLLWTSTGQKHFSELKKKLIWLCQVKQVIYINVTRKGGGGYNKDIIFRQHLGRN